MKPKIRRILMIIMRNVIINFRLPNLKKKKKLITDPTLFKRRCMPKVFTLKVKPAICKIWEPKYVIIQKNNFGSQIMQMTGFTLRVKTFGISLIFNNVGLVIIFFLFFFYFLSLIDWEDGN